MLQSQRHLITAPPSVAIRVQFDADVMCERCGAAGAAWHCLGQLDMPPSDTMFDGGPRQESYRLELCDRCYGELCDGVSMPGEVR